jgi:hypothetical protein
MESTSAARIKVLNDYNYATWSLQIKFLLEQKRVQTIVEGMNAQQMRRRAPCREFRKQYRRRKSFGLSGTELRTPQFISPWNNDGRRSMVKWRTFSSCGSNSSEQHREHAVESPDRFILSSAC